METKKKMLKSLEIESVARLAITVGRNVVGRVSVRLDRSKDIDNFGICKPGVIIKKDDEFYLTTGSDFHWNVVSIELVSLNTNKISSLDIDMDTTQINITRYHTNEEEEKEIVDALGRKIWNRMYHVVYRMFHGNFNHNNLFMLLGSKRSKLLTMQPRSKDKILELFSHMEFGYKSDIYLDDNRKNWRIYWYVRDHYKRFILPKLKAKSAVA